MSRVSISTIFKHSTKHALSIPRRIHKTTMDSVKLAEAQKAVHPVAKEYQPSLQFSKHPVSKICEEVKAADGREAAKMAASDSNSRQINTHVGSPRTFQFISSELQTAADFVFKSPAGFASPSTTEKHTLSISTTKTTTTASSAAIAERIQAALASNHSAADLDCAFGL